MKLLRVGPRGQERPALLDAQGPLRDLSAVCRDIDPQTLGPQGLAAPSSIDAHRLPRIDGPVRLGVPWAGCGKLVCVGLNYADHAAEAGMPLPSEPVLFNKHVSCMTGPHDGIVLPQGSIKTDWEVELGVVIGRKARYVTPEEALAHVAGYCVVNDVSEREYQLD